MTRIIKNNLNAKTASFGALFATSLVTLNLGINAMWATGQYTSTQVATKVVTAVVSVVGGAKVNAVRSIVTQALSSGYAAYSHDWASLAYTIADLCMSFVPGAMYAKIVYQVVKLIPVF